MTWLTKWWRWLVGGFVGLLAIVAVSLGGALFWQKKQRELGQLRDELAVANALKRIAELRALREGLADDVTDNAEAIEVIDSGLAANRRAIIEAHDNAEAMTDDEIDEAFTRLGF